MIPTQEDLDKLSWEDLKRQAVTAMLVVDAYLSAIAGRLRAKLAEVEKPAQSEAELS